MRRRLLVANVVFVILLLAVLELPLAIVYGNHEHDALTAALQRDAAAVAGVTQEILEHPDEHDLNTFIARFEERSGNRMLVVRPDGSTPAATTTDSVLMSQGRLATRRQEAVTGETADKVYVAVPVSSRDETIGAIVIARSDRNVDDRVHRFWLFLVGLGVSAVAVVAIVSDRLARWTTRPLRALGDRAGDFGRGALHVRADLDGPPEVAALAARFNDMADRLDELVASQRRFVADASHQLRTPLTALRLRLENLDPRDEGENSARDAALTEVARLSRLVDGLLVLARAEGRRVEREPIDVVEVVTDRQQAWAPLAAEQEVDLRLGAMPATAFVSVTPGMLEQVLDNLIANALEASPAGGVVECRVVRDDGALEVHVDDEGRGMSADDRRHAFDPFWQGRHATGTTGLGLAIVDQLARSNSAAIALRESDRGGVDAVLRLPLHDPSRPRDPAGLSVR